RLKLVVMSPVPMALPGALGTIAFTVQVTPPVRDLYTGPSAPPPGFVEKAVPMIILGLAGFTVRCGSLSCEASPLSVCGIILTSMNPGGACPMPVAAPFLALFLVAVRPADFAFLEVAFLLFFLAGMISLSPFH